MTATESRLRNRSSSPARRSSALALAVLASLFAGCDRPTELRAPAAPGAGASEVALHRIDRPGFDALLTHHPRKVVLACFWAMSSQPSRDQVAKAVEIGRKHEADGLVVLSVNCDAAEQLAPAIEFLRGLNASFQHVRSAHGDAQQTFDDFEIPEGVLPHVKLYDRTGTLRRTFPSADEPRASWTAEELEAAVRELLEEPAQAASGKSSEPGGGQNAEAEQN